MKTKSDIIMELKAKGVNLNSQEGKEKLVEALKKEEELSTKEKDKNEE